MLVGGALGLGPVFFSQDSKDIHCSVGGTLRIYSTTTGDLLRTVRLHTDNITGIIPLFNANEILSCSLDGFVTLWDYLTWKPKVSSKIGGTVYKMAIHPAHPGTVWILRNRINPRPDQVNHKTLVQLTLGNPNGKHFYNFTELPADVAISNCGRFVITAHRGSLFVFDIINEGRYVVGGLPSLNCHPTLLKMTPHGLILGDSAGRLLLFKNEPEKYDQLADSYRERVVKGESSKTLDDLVIMHWHSATVNSVCAVPDTDFLLSVGREGVLTIWDLKTVTRQHLPRFGSPLTFVDLAPNKELLALCLANGSVALVKQSTGTVEHELFSIRVPSSSYPKVFPSITNDLTRNHTPYFGKSIVVLPDAAPGSLQLFDTVKNKVVSVVNATYEQYVSPTCNEEPRPSIITAYDVVDPGWIAVSHAVFADSILTDSINPSTVVIKVFSMMNKTEQPTLNTISNIPLTYGHCVGIYFVSNTKFLAVFSGGHVRSYESKRADSVFILNQESSESQKRGPKSAYNWTVSSEFLIPSRVGILTFPVQSSTVSRDGSILALVVQNVLQIWSIKDLKRVILLKSHVLPPCQTKYFVQIIDGNSNNPAVIVYSSDGAYVYDLLSLSLLYDITKKSISCVAVPKLTHLQRQSIGQADTSLFSVAFNDYPRVETFSITKPLPIASTEIPGTFGTQISRTFWSLSRDHVDGVYSLIPVVLSNTGWIADVSLRGEKMFNDVSADRIVDVDGANNGKKNLNLYEISVVGDAQSTVTVNHTFKSCSEIFKSPVYVMPPASKIFSAICEDDLPKKIVKGSEINSFSSSVKKSVPALSTKLVDVLQKFKSFDNLEFNELSKFVSVLQSSEFQVPEVIESPLPMSQGTPKTPTRTPLRTPRGSQTPATPRRSSRLSKSKKV
ncbi:hypothetical protein RCL1_001316 [Eukaryota sp. TZLM3-RCL]